MQDRDVIIKKIQSLADTDLLEARNSCGHLRRKMHPESISLMSYLRSQAYAKVLLI